MVLWSWMKSCAVAPTWCWALHHDQDHWIARIIPLQDQIQTKELHFLFAEKLCLDRLQRNGGHQGHRHALIKKRKRKTGICRCNHSFPFSFFSFIRSVSSFPFFFEPPTFSFIWWPHHTSLQLRPSMKRRMWGSKEKKGKGWPAGHQKSSWTSYQMKRKWWKRFSSSIRTHFDWSAGHLLDTHLKKERIGRSIILSFIFYLMTDHLILSFLKDPGCPGNPSVGLKVRTINDWRKRKEAIVERTFIRADIIDGFVNDCWHQSSYSSAFLFSSFMCWQLIRDKPTHRRE